MLKSDATIAVIAPAGIPRPDGLDAGIALLQSWGYRVLEGAHAREQHRFNAGTAAARIADLQWALTQPGIDAVWLARGGYGCVHTLAALASIALDPRLVIGCSDATALFCALARRGSNRLVHGPMLETLAGGIDDDSRERLRSLLSGGALQPVPAQAARAAIAPFKAPITGGNLCVLASLAGTPWALQAKGSIVLLEDVGEAAYRLDRYVSQLRWSGALDGAVAIALGDFISCPVPAGAGYSIHDVLMDALEFLHVPVIAGLPVGHGRRNLAWRYGETVEFRDGRLARAE